MGDEEARILVNLVIIHNFNLLLRSSLNRQLDHEKEPNLLRWRGSCASLSFASEKLYSNSILRSMQLQQVFKQLSLGCDPGMDTIECGTTTLPKNSLAFLSVFEKLSRTTQSWE